MATAAPNQSDSIHLQIRIERHLATPDPQTLRVFRDYARGVMQDTLTSGQRKILEGIVNLAGHAYCHNLCKMVLRSIRDRLVLDRFEVSSDTQAVKDSLGSFLHDTWTLNRLPSLASRVHWAMLRDGNVAVSVTWNRDANRVQLNRHLWWNGETGIYVSYDDYGTPRYAVEDWITPDGLRRTIWFPDRIERYIWQSEVTPAQAKASEEESWVPYQLEDDDEWPVRWTDAAGEPLGVPVVHFANEDVPNDGPGDQTVGEPHSRYGMSELDGGIVGTQDEINDIGRQITQAARMTGGQMIWATGIDQPVDENGDPEELTVEPGRLLRAASPDARFGVIPPGSVDPLITALNQKIRAVSDMSGVPVFLITGGDWPSGAALYQAASGFIKKMENLSTSIAPGWGSVMHKGSILQNFFGNPAGGGESLDTEAMITAVFAEVSLIDPLTQAQTIAALAPFVSEQEVLRMLGKTPEQVETIMQERRETSQVDQQIKQAQLQRINLGIENDRAGGSGLSAIRQRIAAAQQSGNGKGEVAA